MSFTNLFFDEDGGWFARGVPHSGEDGRPDAGPLRWQNVTRVMLGEQGGSTPSFKLWGYVTGVEVLDSVWDANVAGGAWIPMPGSGDTVKAFLVVQCTQDFVIRNNEIVDHFGALKVSASTDGACDNELARPVDGVVFDKNVFRNTYAWGLGLKGVEIKGERAGHTEGDVAGESIQSVVVTNNFLSSVGGHPWDTCVTAHPGNDAAPPGGRVVIAHNTCFGPVGRDGGAAITIGTTIGLPQPQRFLQDNYLVVGNVVDGLDPGDKNLLLGFRPTARTVIDHNVYDPAGLYAFYDGQNLQETADLDAWRQTTGVDPASVACDPVYRDVAAGDFHLAKADDCARDQAAPLSEWVPRDIDFEARPQDGGWDAGADEVGSKIFGARLPWAANPPTAPRDLRWEADRRSAHSFSGKWMR